MVFMSSTDNHTAKDNKMSANTNTNTNTYMNPNTGSVDTLAGWDLDTHEEAIANGLVMVIKDSDGYWVEADYCIYCDREVEIAETSPDLEEYAQRCREAAKSHSRGCEWADDLIADIEAQIAKHRAWAGR